MGCCCSSPDDTPAASRPRATRDDDAYQSLPDDAKGRPAPSPTRVTSTPSRQQASAARESVSVPISAGSKASRDAAAAAGAAGASPGRNSDVVGSLRQSGTGLDGSARAASGVGSAAAARAGEWAKQKAQEASRRRAIVEKAEEDMLEVQRCGLSMDLEDAEDEEAVQFASTLVATRAAVQPGAIFLGESEPPSSSAAATPPVSAEPDASLMHLVAVL